VKETHDGKPVPIERWGKDHLSTLLYCESRAVDHEGRLDTRHMRAAASKYPTRLAGGDELVGHDDYDCIADMEKAGLIENLGTGLYPAVRLTPYGWIVAGALRRYRAEARFNKDDRAPFVVPARPALT
jgi:hypothetical protein